MEVDDLLAELNLAQSALEATGYAGDEETIADTLSERAAVDELLATLGDAETELLDADGTCNTLDSSSLAAVDVMKRQLSSWNRGKRRTRRRSARESARKAARWLDGEVRRLVSTIQSLASSSQSGPSEITVADLKDSASDKFESLGGTLKTAQERGYVRTSQILTEELDDDSVVVTLLTSTVEDSDASSYTLKQLRRSTRRLKGRAMHRTSSEFLSLQPLVTGDHGLSEENEAQSPRFRRGRSNVVSLRKRPATVRRKPSKDSVVSEASTVASSDDSTLDTASLSSASSRRAPDSDSDDSDDYLDMGTMICHSVQDDDAPKPFADAHLDDTFQPNSGVLVSVKGRKHHTDTPYRVKELMKTGLITHNLPWGNWKCFFASWILLARSKPSRSYCVDHHALTSVSRSKSTTQRCLSISLRH